MPSKRIWTPYNGGSQTGSCTSTHNKCQTMHITNKRNIIQSTYTIHNHNLQTTNTAKYLGINSTLNWNTHQQDCTETKHNFSLSPQKYSHMPTQNQTPSLHNTSTSHLRICKHHLGPAYSLQHPQTLNSTTPLSQTHHAQLQ